MVQLTKKRRTPALPGHHWLLHVHRTPGSRVGVASLSVVVGVSVDAPVYASRARQRETSLTPERR